MFGVEIIVFEMEKGNHFLIRRERQTDRNRQKGREDGREEGRSNWHSVTILPGVNCLLNTTGFSKATIN